MRKRKLPVLDKTNVNGGLLFEETVCLQAYMYFHFPLYLKFLLKSKLFSNLISESFSFPNHKSNIVYPFHFERKVTIDFR